MKFYTKFPPNVHLLFIEHFLVMFRILCENRGDRKKNDFIELLVCLKENTLLNLLDHLNRPCHLKLLLWCVFHREGFEEGLFIHHIKCKHGKI